MPGSAGEVAVHLLEVLVAGLRRRRDRRRAGPFLQVRAVHLPAHRHPLGLHPRLRGGALAVLGHPLRVVGGEDAEVQRLVRPSLTPPWRVVNVDLGAPAASLRVLLVASSSAVSSSASRPRHEAVELAVERLVQRAPERRALGQSRASRSSPESRAARASARRPSAGSAPTARQRQGQRQRLERLPPEQRAQLRGRVLALAQRRRDLRRRRAPLGRRRRAPARRDGGRRATGRAFRAPPRSVLPAPRCPVAPRSPWLPARRTRPGRDRGRAPDAARVWISSSRMRSIRPPRRARPAGPSARP